MEDDQEYESECEEEPSVNHDACNEEADATDVPEVLAPLQIDDLADQLLIDGNKCFNLSVDDEQFICGLSVNRKKYNKSKEGVEKRFFETIEQYGNAELKKLLTMKVLSGMLPKCQFYTILCSLRTEQKCIILGKCLLICVLKWRNLTRKDYGKPLQPSTWDTNLKILFAKFHMEGIEFKHMKHFIKDGQFHTALI
jgi:hypothetical protein